MALHQTWLTGRLLKMVVADEERWRNGFAPNVVKT